MACDMTLKGNKPNFVVFSERFIQVFLRLFNT